MLPVNKKQLQNPDNHNLDFAVVFLFFLMIAIPKW